MKRVERRAVSVLALAALILLGTAVLLWRLTRQGYAWATYSANEHIYHNGVLTGGTITDRNGVVLLHTENGEYT